MGFKMKGPGLPGFRKQQGSGFYKSNPTPMTAHRSPMKQGEDKGGTDWDAERQKMIDQERKAYNDYIKNGGDPSKINWKEKVSNIDTTIESNKNKEYIAKQVETSIQRGTIPGANVEKIATTPEEIAAYKKYQQGVKDGTIKRNTKYDPINVAVQDMDVREFEPPKETEFTNFSVTVDKMGFEGDFATMDGTAKVDQNDGTPRYKFGGGEGVPTFNGEMSRNDIERLLKEGKFKYKYNVDKDGNKVKTNELLMSKDFYENNYLEQVKQKEFGDAKREKWFADEDAWRNKSRVDMVNQYNQEIENLNGWNKKKQKAEIWNRLEYERNLEGMELGFNEQLHPNIQKRIDKGEISKEDAISSYGDKKRNADFMYGDPNFGSMGVGIYNDDEVLSYTDEPPPNGFNPKRHRGQGDFDKHSHSSNMLGEVGTGNNAQGSRPNDWEFNEDGTELVLKEGAKTLPADQFTSLSKEAQEMHLMSFEVNEDATEFIKDAGYMRKDADGGGTFVPGTNVRLGTKYDHLLTSVQDGSQNHWEELGMGENLHESRSKRGFVSCTRNPELCVDDGQGNLVRKSRWNDESHLKSSLAPDDPNRFQREGMISDIHLTEETSSTGEEIDPDLKQNITKE